MVKYIILKSTIPNEEPWHIFYVFQTGIYRVISSIANYSTYQGAKNYLNHIKGNAEQSRGMNNACLNFISVISEGNGSLGNGWYDWSIYEARNTNGVLEKEHVGMYLIEFFNGIDIRSRIRC